MKIAFLGDLHGRVFHSLAVLVKWQNNNKEKLDLIIQAGDFGAFPYPDEAMMSNRFVQKDPTELDFSRFFAGSRKIQEFNDIVKAELTSPVYFIRGNHEDFNWLSNLPDNNGICSVDKYGIFKYIKDGTVIDFGNITFGFLGGAEFGAKGDGVIDMSAYTELMETNRRINILVTHETHFGIGLSYHGLTQGSKYISELGHKLNPDYHITAHYHHMIGPHQRGDTVHMGLNNLVLPLRGKPGRNLRAGCMAIMNTETDSLEFVREKWLTDISTASTIDDLIKGLNG